MKKTSITFLFIGILLILSSTNFSFTGNTIGNTKSINGFFSIYIALVLIIFSIILFVKEDLEAIVVPTGPSYEADQERARGGAEEYHRHEEIPGHSDVVIISGEFDGGRFLGSKPDKICRTLRRAGVPKRDIILEDDSGNTRENVLYTCEELEKRKIDEVTIVTDKPHARRFKMLFGKAIRKGYAPRDLEVHTYSEGIEPSYGPVKAFIAYIKYIKDFVKPLRK